MLTNLIAGVPSFEEFNLPMINDYIVLLLDERLHYSNANFGIILQTIVRVGSPTFSSGERMERAFADNG